MPKIAKWMGNALEGIMSSKMPMMKVVEIVYLTPFVKKVRFQGNLTAMNFQLGYAVFIRINDTEYRNYTVSETNLEQGTLEIIFHLHGNGPGSHFIDKLKIGNQIRIGVPRGKKMYDQSAEKHLIFGDETSLGLAKSLHRKMDEDQKLYFFYFELDDINSHVPEHIGLKNYIVFPKNSIFKNSKLLDNLPIFKLGNWNNANFILTGNANSIQIIRTALKTRSCIGKIYSQGFWLENKAGL